MDKNQYDSNVSTSSEKEGWKKKAGDSIERLGEKISRAGAEKIGKTVYDAGNKLEHADDKKI